MTIRPVLLSLLCAVIAAPAPAWASGSTLMSTPVEQSATIRGDLPGPGRPGVFALRTSDQWKAFQGEQRLNWPVAIDFNRDMVIAVMLGTRNSGGYTAKISDVRATDWVVEVTYSEIPPQATQPVIQTLTNPYVLSVIAQSQNPVVFSRGHFGMQAVPYTEYTRLIRKISELSYQLDDEQRKNAMAQGRIRDLTDLLTRSTAQPAN
ncbi:protease complex subunit PrcB family protein [Magnetovibrio sp.]|uniref:protease complex subunit PrcB family protein n=1 Tax=Magnetovibrio sp. TaxID=2024836 RepID=UPI002F9499FA